MFKLQLDVAQVNISIYRTAPGFIVRGSVHVGKAGLTSNSGDHVKIEYLNDDK